MAITESSFHHGPILTATDVSRYLKIPLSTLYALTKKGKIKGIKVGKHWRYSAEAIEAFFHSKSESSDDRRQNPRLNCEIAARLCISLERRKARVFEGSVHNVGNGGALFIYSNGHTEASERIPVEVGDPVILRFRLPSDTNGAREVEGRIIYLEWGRETRFGIKFRNVEFECKEAIDRYVG